CFCETRINFRFCPLSEPGSNSSPSSSSITSSSLTYPFWHISLMSLFQQKLDLFSFNNKFTFDLICRSNFGLCNGRDWRVCEFTHQNLSDISGLHINQAVDCRCVSFVKPFDEVIEKAKFYM